MKAVVIASVFMLFLTACTSEPATETALPEIVSATQAEATPVPETASAAQVEATPVPETEGTTQEVREARGYPDLPTAPAVRRCTQAVPRSGIAEG